MLSIANPFIATLMFFLPGQGFASGKSEPFGDPRNKPFDNEKKISIERAVELYEKIDTTPSWEGVPDAAVLAWGESSTLQILLDMYEVTGDRRYLDEMASRADRVLSYRDDRRGAVDGSGESRPAWTMGLDFVTAEARLVDGNGQPVIELRSRTYDYNNSTQVEVRPLSSSRFTLVVSNERKERIETFSNLSLNPSDDRYIEKIVNDPVAPPNAKPGNYTDESHLLRVTKVHHDRQPTAQSLALTPIPLAFSGYVGMIYDPMMRFAEIVRKEPVLSDLLPAANRFIDAAEESYVDLSARLWRNGPGREEGYYLCSEKGESFPWDNVGLPYNFLAKHVRTELALYRLTGKREYLDRSTRIINHFRNRLEHDAESDTYSWGYWFEPVTTVGWKPSDNISENMPFLKPFGGPESVSYASLTISLVTAAYQMRIGFDQTDMRRFANTLLKNILNEDRTRIRGNVAGKGREEDNLSELYSFLPLAEGDSRVYHALREAYMNWEGEQVRYCAGLLKWEKK